jgi:CheY-like chemotaxis protein
MVDNPCHVLLVEDDRDTREMYLEYLSYSGMVVTEAATGRRALERVAEHRPDIVVTDIAMPEMDGLELSRRLRAEATTRDVPIIAVSGQASERAPRSRRQRGPRKAVRTRQASPRDRGRTAGEIDVGWRVLLRRSAANMMSSCRMFYPF